jgi:hypothetical protein
MSTRARARRTSNRNAQHLFGCSQRRVFVSPRCCCVWRAVWRRARLLLRSCYLSPGRNLATPTTCRSFGFNVPPASLVTPTAGHRAFAAPARNLSRRCRSSFPCRFLASGLARRRRRCASFAASAPGTVLLDLSLRAQSLAFGLHSSSPSSCAPPQLSACVAPPPIKSARRIAARPSLPLFFPAPCRFLRLWSSRGGGVVLGVPRLLLRRQAHSFSLRAQSRAFGLQSSSPSSSAPPQFSACVAPPLLKSATQHRHTSSPLVVLCPAVLARPRRLVLLRCCPTPQAQAPILFDVRHCGSSRRAHAHFPLDLSFSAARPANNPSRDFMMRCCERDFMR